MLERILIRLADHIADRLIDHTDEIAAAVAREIMKEIGPKLPDLSALPERLVPDFAGLAKQIVDQIMARIPFLGGIR
jgi:hypothetical protein